LAKAPGDTDLDYLAPFASNLLAEFRLLPLLTQFAIVILFVSGIFVHLFAYNVRTAHDAPSIFTTGGIFFTFTHLGYIDQQWLRTNFDKIFPRLFDDNFKCALEGLAYSPASKSIYSLLKEFSVVENALRFKTAGKYSREKMIERLCLAYLWAAEDLQSERFSLLFETSAPDDLLEATQFFWGIRGEKLSDDQIERIVSFWVRCISWSEEIDLVPDKLLSKLSVLTCYLKSISPRLERLLFAVAPYVHVNYNADNFIKELGRLVENSPDEVSAVLGKVLETYTPSYDFEDKLKNLLIKLMEKGKRADVILYAERLRNLPGMPEFYAQAIRG